MIQSCIEDIILLGNVLEYVEQSKVNYNKKMYILTVQFNNANYLKKKNRIRVIFSKDKYESYALLHRRFFHSLMVPSFF